MIWKIFLGNFLGLNIFIFFVNHKQAFMTSLALRRLAVLKWVGGQGYVPSRPRVINRNSYNLLNLWWYLDRVWLKSYAVVIRIWLSTHRLKWLCRLSLPCQDLNRQPMTWQAPDIPMCQVTHLLFRLIAWRHIKIPLMSHSVLWSVSWNNFGMGALRAAFL